MGEIILKKMGKFVKKMGKFLKIGEILKNCKIN